MTPFALAFLLLIAQNVFFVNANPHPKPDFNNQCSSLKQSLKIPNTKINLAEIVKNGTRLDFANLHPTCTSGNVTVKSDICRITMNTTTSATSQFYLEAFLPIDWNGRFMTTGNGGLGGCIQYSDMSYGSDQGFATVGTNNGHDGNYGLPFYQKPEVVKDFSYRAMRKSIKQGKQIIKQFYGKKQKKSYYLGCSTGGRQGLREVQDIGTEFDGVIIGAPAIDFNNLNAWDGHFYPTIGKNTSQDFITPDQWKGLIYNDIMKKCDGLDGAIDNIVEDSFKCQYKANDLLCQSTPSKDCLTQKQVDIVNAVYSPLTASNGTLLYPRLTPGGTMAESVRFYFGGHVSAYSDWLEYVIYQDPNWDPLSFTQDQWSKPQDIDPAGVSTFKGDLSKFKKSGAKLLHYHGSADGIISPENSPRYYDKVSKTMKLSSKQLDEFYRFFRISGMGHCSGGNGAHFIGNQYVNLASYKPEENVLWAMVQWVEKGIAPEHIVGSALLNNNTVGSPVDYKRKHCRYPRSNVYSGKGDVKDPNSWNCVYPKKK